MARTVGLGIQDFAKILTNKYFYVDKTDFIREWWEYGDDVTLITRPQRGRGDPVPRSRRQELSFCHDQAELEDRPHPIGAEAESQGRCHQRVPGYSW